ncbi:hypothetical protein HanRHA438_Chr08g0341661 [Helianthus annuus]|nr:hypothetical protein HanIR_Chr08g0356941 [Helianthus annuus]KAJ0897074.1 hypothetical protein HanRHA438_Chr08g0341661 [Helianthus annuus]
MIHHISRAITGNPSHRSSPVFPRPPFNLVILIVSFKRVTGPQRKYQKVLHSTHEWKLLFVMQHVSDRSRRRITHSQTTTNPQTPRLSIHRRHQHGLKQSRIS